MGDEKKSADESQPETVEENDQKEPKGPDLRLPIEAKQTFVQKLMMHGKRNLSVAVAIIVLASFGVWAMFFNTSSESATNDTTTAQNTNESDQKTDASEGEDQTTESVTDFDVLAESDIPDSLLQSNGNTSGYSLGYVRKTTSTDSSWNWLFKPVSAQSVSYSPTLFYRAPVDGIEQIYAYDVTTDSTTQVSDEVGETKKPVFSSLAQQLVFSHYTNGRNCELVFLDSSNSVLARAQGPTTTGDSCLEPVSFSPDGTLLYALEVFSSPEDILGGFNLIIVDISDYSVTTIDYPTPFDSVYSRDGAVWTDNQTIVTELVEKAPFGEYAQQQLFALNVSSGETQAIENVSEFDISTISVLDNYFYVISNNGDLLQVSTTDFSQVTVLGEDVPSYSYLVRQNENGEVTEILYTVGEAGEEDTFSLQGVKVSDGTVVNYQALGGYSNYLVSWGVDFDNFLYIRAISGASELHSYNLPDKQDQLLLEDLSLVQ